MVNKTYLTVNIIVSYILVYSNNSNLFLVYILVAVSYILVYSSSSILYSECMVNKTSLTIKLFRAYG